MEENIDIKWLEEYAEQEKKYKWGKEIKKLIKRNKELKDILKERQEDKERIEELEDIKNKAIGHIECCKTTLGNYILSPNETEYLLHLLKGDK